MKKLHDLIDKHIQFCDQCPPGPWKAEDNQHTGLKEIYGEKNVLGDKLLEIKRWEPKALDFVLYSRALLPRYIDALEFLVECYQNSMQRSEVCRETLNHVEKILQGVE